MRPILRLPQTERILLMRHLCYRFDKSPFWLVPNHFAEAVETIYMRKDVRPLFERTMSKRR